jgi:hypothetical protein
MPTWISKVQGHKLLESVDKDKKTVIGVIEKYRRENGLEMPFQNNEIANNSGSGQASDAGSAPTTPVRETSGNAMVEDHSRSNNPIGNAMDVDPFSSNSPVGSDMDEDRSITPRPSQAQVARGIKRTRSITDLNPFGSESGKK